jgi:hypothetical protein
LTYKKPSFKQDKKWRVGAEKSAPFTFLLTNFTTLIMEVIQMRRETCHRVTRATLHAAGIKFREQA